MRGCHNLNHNLFDNHICTNLGWWDDPNIVLIQGIGTKLTEKYLLRPKCVSKYHAREVVLCPQCPPCFVRVSTASLPRVARAGGRGGNQRTLHTRRRLLVRVRPSSKTREHWYTASGSSGVAPIIIDSKGPRIDFTSASVRAFAKFALV